MAAAGQLMTGLAQARARYALEAAGLDTTAPMMRADSVTNEVWLTDEVAVRVNRRPDKRLFREAQLAPHLPPEVGYPDVIGYGTGSGFDWLVLARRPGRVLARCWPTMSPTDRRLAIRQLTFILRSLHATPVPPGLEPLPDTPQLLVTGEDPVAPLLAALDKLHGYAHVDHSLLASLVAFTKATAPLLGRFDEPTFVHGDLTFENVLWDGEEITALIDFEWARAAPPDVELDVLLRFCAYPFLHVAADYELATKAEDYEDIPWWIREDYPELFDSRRALDRVRLYGIAFDVRELLAYPPTQTARDLNEHHPLRRLSRLAAGTSHLDALA
jgi:hypothetical protein